MDEVDLGCHQDEFVEAAIFEMDFSEPAEDGDMIETGFFADFANCGLFGVFAGFDMTLRDCPAVF